MAEENKSEAGTKFAAIGLTAETVTNVIKNKKVTASLLEILEFSGVSECPKEKGVLFYALATKLKPAQLGFKGQFAK